MQHTWRKLARFAFGGVARPWAATFSLRTRESTIGIGRNLQIINAQSRCLVTAASSPSALPSSPTTNSLESNESDDSEKQPFTPAEISRLASHTVRHLVSEGNLRDAYLIVNSIRYASVMHRSKLPGIRSMAEFRSFAFAFPPTTPPRLASHSLLHGLVRLRLHDQASKLAGQMMLAGIRVRSKTLDTIITNFVEDSRIEQSEAIKSSPPTIAALSSRKILTISPSSTKNKQTKFVLNLLMVARQASQRRTKTMFKILLALCILNGEIILASLVFGTLLRDWQARTFNPETRDDVPKPSSESLLHICRAIDSRISSKIGNEYNSAEFGSGLQSLGILANLLDQGLLDLSNIAPLIKTISHCPPIGDKIWILRPDGIIERVDAYAFFHEVLDRFIDSLSTLEQQPSTPDDDTAIHQGSADPNHPVPSRKPISLDTPSCNSLLNYALHVRVSDEKKNTNIEQAKKVLQYMTDLNRRDRVTDKILGRLSEKDKRQLRTDDKMAEMMPIVNLNDPQNLVSITQGGDRYALSNYIQLLVRSGKATIVADAIPTVLPGLLRKQGSAEDNSILESYANKENAELLHAASLGPVAFSSLLHAVHKCRRTELAEKIWSWARKAEKISWEAPNPSGVINPWCIPIQMYTTMIQVYGLQAQRLGQKNRGSVGSGERETTRISLKSKLAAPIAHSKAMSLYRSMLPISKSIDAKLDALEASGKPACILQGHLEVPHRDSRFLNALIKVVRSRKQRVKPKDRRLDNNDNNLAEATTTTPYVHPDSGLLALSRDLTAMGLRLPPTHRKILFGYIQSVRIPQMPVLPSKSQHLLRRFIKARKSLPMYYKLNTWTRAKRQANM